MIRIEVLVSAIVLALLACCAPSGDGPRTITLENNPFVKLPGARADVVGGDMIVTTIIDPTTDAGEGFEPLQQGRSYHAWATRGGDTTHLGSFTPGVALEADLAGSADEVLISIEEGTPSTPSSTIVVSGAADDELSFGKLDAVAFSGARATALVGDTSIDLDYQGLPELPEGYRYELWLTPLADDGQPGGEPISAGGLEAPAGAMARFEDEELPEHFDLTVAIEVAGGRGAMSPALCLQVVHSHEGHAGGSSGGGGGGGGHEH